MTQSIPTLSEAEARAEICRVGRELFSRSYVHATAGNISVKLKQGFLITPTDACLGNLVPERLALLDDHGQQISGDRASKTIVLHRRIYEASAATKSPARCVIHTHSTHLVACSLQADSGNVSAPAEGELLPPITPYFVMKVGRVPHISYHRPGASAAADEVVDAINRYAQAGRDIRAVMLARLGPNVWHTTPAAAMATLEELEETARLWLLTRPSSLSEANIDELRQQFGAIW